MTHNWPTEDDHLFGPWMTRSRTEKYRVCVHPDCHEVEVKEVENG